MKTSFQFVGLGSSKTSPHSQVLKTGRGARTETEREDSRHVHPRTLSRTCVTGHEDPSTAGSRRCAWPRELPRHIRHDIGLEELPPILRRGTPLRARTMKSPAFSHPPLPSSSSTRGMEHGRTGRRPRAETDAIRRLPPELRRDISHPDRCTARMTVRGRDRACHESW